MTPYSELVEWKKDCHGHDARALYLGALFVGSIMPGFSTHHPDEWRGWFMQDEDGEETGWFKTENEARISVEDKLREAIGVPKR